MSQPITIGEVRFSYCHLFQPVKQNDNAPPKYSATILLPKSNTAAKAAIDRAIEQAINEGLNKNWNGVKPPVLPEVIYDGDGVRSNGTPFGSECKGHWVFTARSNQAPCVVDARVQNIINPQEVYSGMYGNVNVNFYPYNFNGKKGIGCGLNHVQKVRDGEPLGTSRVTAAEAFQPVAQPENNGYAAPAAGYGNYPPAGTNQGYGTYGNTNQNYSNAPSYGNTNQNYSNTPGYGNNNQSYGTAPGYGNNQAANTNAGYGNPAPNGYGANTNAGYGYQVDPNMGEALNNGYGYAPGDPYTESAANGGYTPSGMSVAGI